MGGEVLESLAARAQAIEVKLELDLEVKTMRLDADLMRRVLENLIDNALRHAPPSTAIVFSSRRLEDGDVELRVSDHGEGIAPAMRDKIFERFVQVQASEALVPRTSRGLGLTFCKVAIEAHGGTIHIENAAPGAAFCMRFPRDH
jgi:two-component system sensor histidine kinase/response regulator